jgi:hypothetical protein
VTGTSRDRSAALRARRDALRSRLRRRAPRRRPWWLLLLAVLLAVLAAACCCAGEPEDPVEAPPPAAAPAAGGSAPAPPPPPLGGRVAPRPRPAFEPPRADELPWLAGFRMQVAARSPRLASCFVGVERPGSLKWTALVEPVSGRVSDHTLEPTLSSDPLTPPQRACVLGALSEPPYRLQADARATPSRVGMAIEF